MNIYKSLEQLIQYGIEKQLINKYDVDYVRNQLQAILKLEDWKMQDLQSSDATSPVELLNEILDWASENGRLEHNTTTYRDLLDTEIMGAFIARPSTIIEKFYSIYRENGPQKATEFFYQLSMDSHYIRTDRIAKNEHWYSETEYGDLEITINLSKTKKDPIAIAAERNQVKADYPKCLLCKENVGYAGRVNHPARQNHRIIPVELGKQEWFLQYSPYVYYNEHAIILSGEHAPMKISRQGFERLIDFVDQFPHFFVGSNADLPIVGGSILSHDHFQGGNHDFPMAKAEVEYTFTIDRFEQVKAGIVHWPMSVIRLNSENKQELLDCAEHILEIWKQYDDHAVDIYSQTDGERHNTITPIARKRGEQFEMDLVLRNNRTNDEHPLGIFHPHNEVHHIKKENIGLIEVMGLAVLPGRLKEELQKVSEYLLADDAENALRNDEMTSKHTEWALAIKEQYSTLREDNVSEIVRQEVGKVFSTVLEHAGVYKRTEEGKQAFKRFAEQLSK